MAVGGLKTVLERVERAADRAGRDSGTVTVVAVSKTVGADEILAAYEAGHRDFGENRAHELVAKAAQLPDDIEWHFIGGLQSRKAKEVAPIAAMVHSVDRSSLIDAFAKEPSHGRLLLQVNLAHEEQKHGADPAAVLALLEHAASADVSLDGLMLMPPLVSNPEDNRHWFRRLADLRAELIPDWPGLTELSMGMTDDFEVAVEEGATLIRVGRAIFET